MILDIKKAEEFICKELRSFTDRAVIGMSGGADSTLVTMLCAKALGAENVFGIGMPYSEKDLSFFNSRSKKIAVNLGISYKEINIKNMVDSVTNILETTSLIGSGNIRARVRMITLYDFCSKFTTQRVRVIGTGNLSEDFIGYDTKGGDSLADIFPIGNLFKSEVYQFLDYYVANGLLLEENIDRIPSAGLWDGQTDEGELGVSYNDMEPSIKKILNGNLPKNEIDEFVWNRHIQNKHKHEAIPVIQLREFCE